MSLPFPSPDQTTDPRVIVLRQLAFLRGTVIERTMSLSDDEQRHSRLPSGWTPRGLLTHLAHMEQRWIVWGFLGEPVAEPWGDHAPGPRGTWAAPDDVSTAQLVDRLEQVAARTREVLTSSRLEDLAATGGRFESDPPSLAAVALHVLAEYARHLGHLDIAVELAGGPTGE